ncbi:hypothetical protein FPZ45_10915 [Cohnella terricola]|uniref:DUF998 domain-containing protein n=1 Tax=Cohnella terricola TaxID=1289167 RepID=A0A559JKY5_9BACL|nr:hypothetical protein FPZ45_10915 [Cohnella terricola]
MSGGVSIVSKNNRIVVLISSFILGLLIMFSPNIITGSSYDTTHVMGGLLTAEFVVRTIVIVIGLIVIYDGIKNYFYIK